MIKLSRKHSCTLRASLVSWALLLVYVGTIADDEDQSQPLDLASCIAELKAQAANANGSADLDSVGTLQESIRLFDECMKKLKAQTCPTGECSGPCSGDCDGAGTAGSDAGQTASSNQEGESEQQSKTSQSGEPLSSGGNESLASSLESFDAMLAEQRDSLDSERTDQDSTEQQTPAGSEPPNFPQSNTSEKLSSLEEVTSSLEEDEGTPDSDARQSDAALHQQEEERLPLDPSQEDVVLKTIRAAAEMEEDPEIKEALWDQYYDYVDKQ